jgi:HlyD family secretion protein
VDVALEGPLPKGARPALAVDGTILLQRLPDVIQVQRPSFGSANTKVEMFKLIDEGKAAVRVPVEFGVSSVQTMEIKGGLQPGDEVILSETSQYDGHNKIRLN